MWCNNTTKSKSGHKAGEKFLLENMWPFTATFLLLCLSSTCHGQQGETNGGDLDHRYFPSTFMDGGALEKIACGAATNQAWPKVTQKVFGIWVLDFIIPTTTLSLPYFLCFCCVSSYYFILWLLFSGKVSARIGGKKITSALTSIGSSQSLPNFEQLSVSQLFPYLMMGRLVVECVITH